MQDVRSVIESVANYLEDKGRPQLSRSFPKKFVWDKIVSIHQSVKEEFLNIKKNKHNKVLLTNFDCICIEPYKDSSCSEGCNVYRSANVLPDIMGELQHVYISVDSKKEEIEMGSEKDIYSNSNSFRPWASDSTFFYIKKDSKGRHLNIKFKKGLHPTKIGFSADIIDPIQGNDFISDDCGCSNRKELCDKLSLPFEIDRRYEYLVIERVAKHLIGLSRFHKTEDNVFDGLDGSENPEERKN